MIQDNQTHMHPKMRYTYVGCDSHKQSHTFVFIDCFFKKLGELTVSNMPSDFPKFLTDAQQFRLPHTDFYFSFEDISRYGRMMVKFLMREGYQVKHVNANLVASERNSRNILHKNDSVDAECCARVLLNRFDELPLAGDDDRFFIINMLVTKRQSMSRHSRRLKSQLHDLLFEQYPNYHQFFSRLDTKSALAFYEKYPTPHTLEKVTEAELTDFFNQIITIGRAKQKAKLILEKTKDTGVKKVIYQETIDSTIRLTVKQLRSNLHDIALIESQMADFLTHFNITLTSMKGIDTLTACRIIAEVKDINRFKNAAALAKFAGISPTTHASGNHEVQYANSRGNRQLNSIFSSLALFVSMPLAGTNLIVNPFFHAHYNKKLSEGKTHKQALKSVSRRLVNIIYGMLKHGEDYINPPVTYIKETGEILQPNPSQLTHQTKMQSSLK